MKRGKFEAARKAAKSQAPSPEPASAQAPKAVPIPSPEAAPTPEPDQAGGKKRLPWLLLLLPVLAAALFGALWLAGALPANEETTVGYSREETLALYRQMSERLELEDLVLTLCPDEADSAQEPIVLRISPKLSRVRVDLGGVEHDLANGVGRVSRKRYVLNPADYVSLDLSALRELAEQTAQSYNQGYVASFAVVTTRQMGKQSAKDLSVNIGRVGRELSADAIYAAMLDAYYHGELAPTMQFHTRTPAPLRAGTIWREATTMPVDAELNEQTFEITPDQTGYGFRLEELERLLAQAEPGRSYVLPFRELPAALTAADVEDALYSNVLAEAHTPHTRTRDRTNNLILACEAINGTVLMPGEVFSFNQTVGERTVAKGYREAMAYIGGSTVPEIGGGVCQVASSIYYAALQADLPSVERHTHTYLVTYVPMGMDAAIYWGQLDYQFENISPYPIKIEADVSDGQVHIYLRGREWKDYTVSLSYKVLEEIPYEVKERVVYDDQYKNGETIVSPYTGYRVSTYKTLYDLDGEELETVHITNSRYAKRDKVVAVVKKPETPAPSGDD